MAEMGRGGGGGSREGGRGRGVEGGGCCRKEGELETWLRWGEGGRRAGIRLEEMESEARQRGKTLPRTASW